MTTALLMAAVGLASACQRAPDTGGTPSNLILISLDTLRADRLGCYGYERPTSPSIDRLAERGARFSRVIAESSWTLPSHMSLMTGLHPSNHGVTLRDRRLSESVPLLAQILRRAGFRTFGMTGGGLVGRTWGFDRGFEEYDDRKRTPLREVLHMARERIESLDPEERYFLFLHSYDVHGPYDPPDRFGGMFRTTPPEDHLNTKLDAIDLNKMDLRPGQVRFISDQYDAGIRAADEELGEFFDWLDRRGELADTAVVFLSDHGEQMGEHGAIGHGVNLYIEVLRIPLIVIAPGVAPQVVEEPAGLVDVAPTVLDLLGLKPLPADGRSLSPFLRRHETPDRERPLFSELERPSKAHSVVRGDRHLILDLEDRSPPRLFDLEEDPAESQALPVRGQDAVLREDLDRHLVSLSPVAAPDRPTISAAVAERLRALGYADEADEGRGADALIEAARRGDLAAVGALIGGGADVNDMNVRRETPLLVAAENGNVAVVDRLLERGADVNAEDQRGAPALVRAAGNGHLEVVESLLAHGAGLDPRGETPLVAAASGGHAGVVAALIYAGADVNGRNWLGQRALHVAVENDHGEVVRLLLAARADPNATSDDGATPVLAAAALGRIEMARALLAGGADPGLPAKDGRTPLITAAVRGDSAMISLLLAHGAAVDGKLDDGSTALFEAVTAEQPEAARVLLAAGADVEARSDGAPPLMSAVSLESVDIVEILLDHGADANARSDDRSTPLHLAVDDGNVRLVEILLAHGADPLAADEDGETPLDLAEDADAIAMVRILRSAIGSRAPPPPAP